MTNHKVGWGWRGIARRATVVIAAVTVIASLTQAARANDVFPAWTTAATRAVTPFDATVDVTVGEPVFLHSETAENRTISAWDEINQGRTEPACIPSHLESIPDAVLQPTSQARPCWSYALNLPEAARGKTLWVDVDTNNRGQCWHVELWSPGTYTALDPAAHPVIAVHCPAYRRSTQVWNLRLPAQEVDATGTWVVRVVPSKVQNWSFRVRVLVDDQPAPTDEIAPPDLEPRPPYEFGFVAPSSPQAGRALDHNNPPGSPGTSCTAGERAELGEPTPTVKCLRFSAGIYNVGAGPLDLRFWGEGENGPVVQAVRRDNGDLAHERPAGEWSYHADHDHDHYLGFAQFELHRVVWRAPLPSSDVRLELVGTGRKTGWNSAAQRFADWSRFGQGEDDTAYYRCTDEVRSAGGRGCVVLSRGWGDHYRWQRPGNFVVFPTHADGSSVDGLYVVVVGVDPVGNVFESDDDNNTSYALIDVTGDTVRVCERGLGMSPWDPHKEVLRPSFWVGIAGGTTADEAVAGCGDLRRGRIGLG